MARYLLVAHQTAQSQELLDAAQALKRDDAEAEFVLLVPATPVGNLLVWERGETEEVARRQADQARARLEERDLRVIDARVGDADPVNARSDEFLEGGRYSAVVISTLPAGMSRWLKLDVISRARRTFPRHRVIHVVGQPSVASGSS